MNNYQNFAASRSAQERYFLDTLPLVRRIARRNFSLFCHDLAEEITQRVALKLWNWKQKRPDQLLSEEEWQKLANTAAHNEIKRFYLQRAQQRASRTDSIEIIDPQPETGNRRENILTGNSRAETHSLLIEIWKIIKNRTVREKYALLLKRPDFISHLLSSRCCRLQEIADELLMTREELGEIVKTLPLQDDEIGRRLSAKINCEASAETVKKARQRILAKLQIALTASENNENKTPFR